MTGLGLATKGKICPIVESAPSGYIGGGGIVYRDRPQKKPTKKECESLYFPKVRAKLIRILKDKFFSVNIKLSKDEPDKL